MLLPASGVVPFPEIGVSGVVLLLGPAGSGWVPLPVSGVVLLPVSGGLLLPGNSGAVLLPDPDGSEGLLLLVLFPAPDGSGAVPLPFPPSDSGESGADQLVLLPEPFLCGWPLVDGGVCVPVSVLVVFPTLPEGGGSDGLAEVPDSPAGGESEGFEGGISWVPEGEAFELPPEGAAEPSGGGLEVPVGGVVDGRPEPVGPSSASQLSSSLSSSSNSQSQSSSESPTTTSPPWPGNFGCFNWSNNSAYSSSLPAVGDGRMAVVVVNTSGMCSGGGGGILANTEDEFVNLYPRS